MSVQAVAWVLEHSAARLGSRLALLSIANHAHPDGTQSFPSYDTIAKEARLSRRQAVRAVATLADEGHIFIDPKASPFGTNVYTITGLAPSDNLSPTRGGNGRWVVTNPANGEVTFPTEPSDISGTNGGGNVTRTVLELTVPQPSKEQPDFGYLWEHFPRKQAKIAAKKAWDKAIANGADPEAIVAGARRFAADPNRDPMFTPHPATWLNEGRWEDEPLPSRNGNRPPEPPPHYFEDDDE